MLKIGDTVRYADINLGLVNRQARRGKIVDFESGEIALVAWDRGATGLPYTAREWIPNLALA